MAVILETDLQLPKDLDRIEFSVSQNGVPIGSAINKLVGVDNFLMPAEIRVNPVGNSDPVLIRAVGFKANIARIERSVFTSVPSDFLAMVRLPLTYLCAGTAREDKTSTCGDLQTCKLGVCETASVDFMTLPVYESGPWSNAETSTRNPEAHDCFNVLTCFSEATRVTVDRTTCTFTVDNDDPANISVGIKLPLGSDGICGGGTNACWIALDRAPEQIQDASQDVGWTNVGPNFTLPPAICQDSPDGSKLVIVASNMCGIKTPITPPCGDWSSATHPADTSESIGQMPNDQMTETPGDPIGVSCGGLSYQPCGDCGQQRRTCKNGSWGAWGECLGQGICTPNESEMCGADGMRVCLSTCDWGDCLGQTCPGKAVEACGNCGTRRRTCTNGEWSEWGTCENPGVCAPGTEQPCGVDGTQACMGNCQWGVCGTDACDGAPSQACGNCGTQNRACDDATLQWSAFGVCGQEGMCEANTTRICGLSGMQTCGGNCQWDAACSGQVCEGPASVPCGRCGVQTRTCDTNTGLWSAWTTCMNEGMCEPGTTQMCGVNGLRACLNTCNWGEECTGQLCPGPVGMTQSCGFCGTQSRECNGATAMWGPFADCTNEGPCNPGSTRRCGAGGTQSCLANCTWPVACTGQSCTGEATIACGDCGIQTRTCDGSTGQWSLPGPCMRQGECTPGETDECGANKIRTCGPTCGFGTCDCIANSTACGESCVNLMTDSLHCGTCERSCDGRACRNGMCAACPSGTHECGSSCLSNSDVNSCGTRCAPCTLPTSAPTNSHVSCEAGACDWACNAGFNLCGDRCASNNDVDACGIGCTRCTAPAGGSRMCSNGVCSSACPPGMRNCDGTCRANDANACGPNCVDCSAPANATATCNGTSCDFTCNSGFHRCGNGCASDTDVTACGSNCVNCATPANSTRSCDGAACNFTCNPGFHRCGNSCASDTDANACGTDCVQCSAPEGATATCVGGVCNSDCPGQTRNCGGTCKANDANACGPNCTDCSAPANATATCNGTACDFTCNSGFHRCGNACASDTDANACGDECVSCTAPVGATAMCVGGMCNSDCPGETRDCGGTCKANDVNACGPNCTDCSAPANARATCNGTACDFTCDSGFHRCGNGCASDTDATACGADCVRCTAPAGATAMCVGGMCHSDCPGNTRDCSGTCKANDANACGPNCTDCSAPANATATCNGTACDFTCISGFHRCGNACASDTDATACGANCIRCDAPEGATAMCVGGMCNSDCPGNTRDCSGTCKANDVDACGPSCVACSAPTGGTVSCNGTSCVPSCGQRANCSGVCVALGTDANCASCGNACTGGQTCLDGACGGGQSEGGDGGGGGASSGFGGGLSTEGGSGGDDGSSSGGSGGSGGGGTGGDNEGESGSGGNGDEGGAGAGGSGGESSAGAGGDDGSTAGSGSEVALDDAGGEGL